jgi:hypothetical protein
LRRRTIPVAAVAALVGGGIGHQAGIAGLSPAPGVGLWVAGLGLVGLVALLLWPAGPSTDLAATTEDTGWIEFRRELRRARRSGRLLTILRIAGAELPGSGAGATDLATHARALGHRLRIVDRAWVDDDSIYVLLPESSRAAAEALIARIRADAPDQLPELVRIATFPENGLTSGAIIATLADGLVEHVPIPIRSMGGEGVVDVAPTPIRAIGGDAAAFAPDAMFAPDDELSVGEAART